MSTNQRLQPQRPRLFDEHGVPTPSAAAAWIHGSALDVSSSTTRFPLRITNHGPYLAPLPYVTEGDRSLQQTTTDINALGQLYIVSPVSPLDLRTLPFNENQSVLATRVELGRFGHPNWQSYPLSATIPARPDLKGSPALLVQQAWMPPYAMPRHPTMAYWGRDLSSTNNSDTTLPTMRAWTPAGQVEQRPMFIHSTEDGELTDRGWGPGVSVHPDLRHGLSRATGSMQRWTLLAEAMQLSEAQREHEERMHNEYHEYDWTGKAGDYVTETPGTIHTLYMGAGSQVIFDVMGSIEFYNDDNTLREIMDGFSFWRMYEEHCAEKGVEPNQGLWY